MSVCNLNNKRTEKVEISTNRRTNQLDALEDAAAVGAAAALFRGRRLGLAAVDRGGARLEGVAPARVVHDVEARGAAAGRVKLHAGRVERHAEVGAARVCLDDGGGARGGQQGQQQRENESERERTAAGGCHRERYMVEACTYIIFTKDCGK